jgi:hypothetical protein
MTQPLFETAIRNGDLAEVAYLLQCPGVDPTADNNDAIRRAAEFGHLAVVERLLQCPGVDPTAVEDYAIRWAAEFGHLAVVERLLQCEGVDPTVHYNVPICEAAWNGHLVVVERLLRDRRVVKLAYRGQRPHEEIYERAFAHMRDLQLRRAIMKRYLERRNGGKLVHVVPVILEYFAWDDIM